MLEGLYNIKVKLLLEIVLKTNLMKTIHNTFSMDV